jgi:predicted unusual protein kinase regulating ubiquinone biosynthesis (AarF/ABC1/UbiB family)
MAGSSGPERLRLLESILEGPSGEECRRGIGGWVGRLVPVEFLVPESARRWRPLVQDAIQFVFSRLSAARLARKLVEQFELPSTAPPERRLIQLISKMPGLQKVGQVLARNRRLDRSLRTALIELENGMSDVEPGDVHRIITDALGPRLEQFAVKRAAEILSEASVSAVIRFTWQNPNRERERAVFKVLKPYVPDCFAEDMSLLQHLGEFLTSRERGYDFAIRDIDEMLTEVRLLLARELDFTREQATLAEAARAFRASIGIRVPRVIPALCTPGITAMSEETGVKVTAAAPRSPIRRGRIAEQLIEALIAVPLFSGQESSVFHADPHAGNLLYHEANRELVVLDWALAERLSRQSRRGLVMLGVMMILRSREGVRDAILALRRPGRARGRTGERIIGRTVDRFFRELPPGRDPGMLDGMRLLDEIAMQGVHFDAALFLFRKSLFTLDGVLNDIAGPEIRMDVIIARQFLTRWAASFGLMYSPLRMRDVLSVEWSALILPARRLLGIGT